jgi:urease accessory protein
VREDRPVLLTNCATGDGVDAVVDAIVENVLFDAL